jgi:hypothetical protein
MRIPKFWARESFTGADSRGKQQTFTAWGWSFQTYEEAKMDAVARAQRIFNYMVQGIRPDRYPYSENPLREETVQLVEQAGQTIGAITRNRYGALVLNSAAVLFADIDIPEGKSGGGGGLKKLFGKKSNEPANDPHATAIQTVKNWAAGNPGRSFRIYRTKAGLRLLFTDRLYEPASSETASLLGALGSDQMYRLLTQRQESFRARLTPKPWRCDCPLPPGRYPFEDARAEQQYRQWEQQYAGMTAGYKTCDLIEVVGGDAADESIRMVVDLHDRYACDRNKTELA